MDRLTSIILWAGLGCFLLAFALSGLYPYLITDGQLPEASIEQIAQRVPPEFKDLKDAWPVAFAAAYPGSDDALTPRQLAALPAGDPARALSEGAWRDAFARALRQGRDTYVSEACWHCHSQYVRPVANESVRFGPVQTPAHDNNALQRPVLWGTRRVGPDLTHEGRLRSNDWHVAHFWDPTSVSPGSVMPPYPWFFREGWQVRRHIDPDAAERGDLPPDTSYPFPGVHASRAEAEAALAQLKEELPSSLSGEKERLFVEQAIGPAARGLSLIAYLQWLGTWEPPAPSEDS